MLIEKYRIKKCGKCGGRGSHRVINGIWLKDIRKKARLTQIQIAKMCEVSIPSCISEIESNNRPCPEKALKVYLKLATQNFDIEL